MRCSAVLANGTARQYEQHMHVKAPRRTLASGAETMAARGQYSSLAPPWGRVSCLAGRAPCRATPQGKAVHSKHSRWMLSKTKYQNSRMTDFIPVAMRLRKLMPAQGHNTGQGGTQQTHQGDTQHKCTESVRGVATPTRSTRVWGLSHLGKQQGKLSQPTLMYATLTPL
jgi:hypothetical protein